MITVQAKLVTTQASRPRLNRIWDNYLEVGEMPKTTRVKFVVAAVIRDGVRYINIREFYYKISEGIWKPSRLGIAIPLEVPIIRGTERIKPLDRLQELIAEALKVVETMDLYDSKNARFYTEKRNRHAKILEEVNTDEDI